MNDYTYKHTLIHTVKQMITEEAPCQLKKH